MDKIILKNPAYSCHFTFDTQKKVTMLYICHGASTKASVILQVLSSGFAVDVNAFTSYCHETAETFIELYPWQCMPTTIHKILIHGPTIVDYSPLPIGQISEDAQEVRNKDIRHYREHFARKNSREATMQDIFNRLLITSDPLISSLTKNHLRKSKSLTPAALELLSVRTDNSSDESYSVLTDAIAYDYQADDSDNSSDNRDLDYDLDQKLAPLIDNYTLLYIVIL